MSRQPRDPAREAGFTLIEVLIAMTLMVGILIALAAVTAQWLPNWNRGFSRVQRTELFAQGLERLVADISAAKFVTTNGKSKQPMFAGDELSMFFVRTAIGPNARPGLEVIRIATTAGERGPTLVRTRVPFAVLPLESRITDLSNFADPVVLISPPYRATFQYAGLDRRWRSVWRDENELPAAVRIVVRDAATDVALAVSTATLLHVTASALCAQAKAVNECIYPPPTAPGAQ